MDCEEIKSVIPKYFNHTATEQEIKIVEEHLCICHDCRSTLGELMDKLAVPEETENTQAKELPAGAPSAAEPSPEERDKMEYVPGDNLGANPNKSQADSVEPKPTEEVTPDPSEPELPVKPAKEPEPLEPSEPPAEPKPAEETVADSDEIEPLPESENQADPLEELKQQEKPPTPKEEYPLDEVPLSRAKVGIFEYACLIIGIAIFGGLLFLLLKG